MKRESLHFLLDLVCQQLTVEARETGFTRALEFETRVREVTQEIANQVDKELSCPQFMAIKDDFPYTINVDMNPPAQSFPDIVLGNVGIEVKFTEADTWRCIANSVLETNKVQSVKHICVVYCKMGGIPEVRYDDWEKAVMHVRTSHVPRFELEIGSQHSLFDTMGITYDDFSSIGMREKMSYIRNYARSRLKQGEHLWWLEDASNEAETHALPLNARLYTNLDSEEKTRLRAEAVLLCPQILGSGRNRHKYDDFVMFLLTYHGVLCHQARDLFSAGSAAGVGGNGRIRATSMERELDGKDFDGIYILRSLLHLEEDMKAAAEYLDHKLFFEYWGSEVASKVDLNKSESILTQWLVLADSHAREWRPSDYLFLDLKVS